MTFFDSFEFFFARTRESFYNNGFMRVYKFDLDPTILLNIRVLIGEP